MQDIWFDIVAREIVLQNNDFELTTNPSVQNGGNVLYSRAANPLAPMVGIGILEIIGGNGSKAAYEMNRWQAQMITDGATLAVWTATNEPGNNIEISTEQSYL